MKTDELADEVRHYRALITSYGDGVALSVAAAVQLADERDAAIKRAEYAERQLAGVMAMRERDAPMWDRLGGVAKTLLGTDSAKVAEQRDRALALLRETTDAAGNVGGEWWQRARALLAEVDDG